MAILAPFGNYLISFMSCKYNDACVWSTSPIVTNSCRDIFVTGFRGKVRSTNFTSFVHSFDIILDFVTILCFSTSEIFYNVYKMTEKDNSSDINYNRIQGENSVFSARCGNESMEDQDLLVATDGTNKVANVDFVHSLLCVSGISSENEVLQPEKSDCLTNCIDKFEHSGDGKTSRGTSKNQDTITKDIWSGNGNTEVPPPIPDGTSVDSESNLKLKNGASRECFSSNSHSPTEDNMSIFTNEAVILKNTSESLNLTTLSENGRRKHDADSDVARNSHEISPKASERADKNNYSEFMCDAVNSTEAQTLDVDNSQLQKAQVESQILMELNHVLTNLGFGFRRDNNTNKCSLQDSNNLRNNVEVGHAKIPFSLQEFSSGLQDQLSK